MNMIDARGRCRIGALPSITQPVNFAVGRIGDDRLADFARRRLAPNLG